MVKWPRDSQVQENTWQYKVRKNQAKDHDQKHSNHESYFDRSKQASTSWFFLLGSEVESHEVQRLNLSKLVRHFKDLFVVDSQKLVNVTQDVEHSEILNQVYTALPTIRVYSHDVIGDYE